MEVKIHGLYKLKPEHQDKIRRAMAMGGPVISSTIWEKKISSAKYKENRGYSGADIVRLVRSGADGPDKKPDNVLDLEIEGFYSWRNTIGYTYLGGFRQWINTRYLGSFSESDVFAHVLHELLHRAYNFKHTFSHAGTVPYLVGKLSGQAFNEFYANPKFFMELVNSHLLTDEPVGLTFSIVS